MADAADENKMRKVVTVKFVGVEDVVEHIQPIREKRKKKVSFSSMKSVQIKVNKHDDDNDDGLKMDDLLVDDNDDIATVSSHLIDASDGRDLLGVDMFNFKVPHKQVKLKRRASEIVSRQQRNPQQQQLSSSSTTSTSPTRRQSKVNFDLNTPSTMQSYSDGISPGSLTPRKSAMDVGGGTPRSILKKMPSMRLGIEYVDDFRKETGLASSITTTVMTATTTTNDNSTTTKTRRSIRLHSINTPITDDITTPTKPTTPLSKHTTSTTRQRVIRKTPLRLWKRLDAEGSSSSDELDTDDEDNDDVDDESTDTDYHGNNDITYTKKTPTKTKDTKTDDDITMTPRSSMKSRTPSRRKSLAVGIDDMPRRRLSSRKPQKAGTTKDSAESYFEQHHTSKSSKLSMATSDRTLSRLGVPKMEPSEITKVLSEFQFPYEKERLGLYERLTGLFDKWMLLMSQNFNILLHGLGSKAKLVEMFRQRMLDDFTCIVVNGFFPSLTLKTIISSLCESLDTGELITLPNSIVDQINKVKKIFREQGHPDTFILINNIDGACLRNDKVQNALSLLCTIKGVHLLATIDHINATLLWDHAKTSRLNWVWFDCTTHDSYSVETSYENSILVQQSGVLLLSSLTHVMKSLTPNARGIFLLISKYQLEAKDEHGYQGIAFPDLYMKCREAFLVNSEPTLRTQLVEFKDHKTIKTKKGLDGVEYIQIALDDDTLTTFVEQHEHQQ